MLDHNIQPGATCFIDTNIWLYCFIRSQDPDKSKVAQAVISDSTIFLSTQIINEMSVNLIRKAKFSDDKILKLITSLYRRYTILELSQDILLKASEIRTNSSFSFWDSIVAASALESDADYLVSEDMQHGFVIDNTLTIINPFE